jgi:hypothetical protein
MAAREILERVLEKTLSKCFDVSLDFSPEV